MEASRRVFGGFAENVARQPVTGATSTQQGAQLFHRRGQQQLGEHALGTVVEVGQLGDAYVRKIARAHAEHFPPKVFGGL